MNAVKSMLDEALESWIDVRRGLIEEFQNIPGSRLDFRPVPEVRSVRELVVHILEVAMMMCGELARPDTNFRRAAWPELLAQHAGRAYEARTKRDLVRLLRSQLRGGQAQLREAGELHMLQLIERFDGQPGTRLAWLHHGIAQEMYHRGQLVLYQRMMGIEPALTRRIRGG
jgi:uncharacterized damage-inducible protein DinB